MSQFSYGKMELLRNEGKKTAVIPGVIIPAENLQTNPARF